MERVRVVIRCKPLVDVDAAGKRTSSDGPSSLSSLCCWGGGSKRGTLRFYKNGNAPLGDGDDSTIDTNDTTWATQPTDDSAHKAVKEYSFDDVFLPSGRTSAAATSSSSGTVGQEGFYTEACLPVLERALGVQLPAPSSSQLPNHYNSLRNATIFAYGQTGSGKTYTIDGAPQRSRASRRHSIGGGGVRMQQGATVADPDAGDEDKDDPDGDDEEEDIMAQLAGGQQKQRKGAGAPSPTSSSSLDDGAGVVPRALETLFGILAARAETTPTPTTSDNAAGDIARHFVEVSFLDIYNEQLRDLLNPQTSSANLRLRTAAGGGGGGGGVASLASLGLGGASAGGTGRKFFVENLSRFRCQSVAEALTHYRNGIHNKVTRSHAMNQQSSRSHSIFTVMVVIERRLERKAKASSSVGDVSKKEKRPSVAGDDAYGSEDDDADDDNEEEEAGDDPSIVISPSSTNTNTTPAKRYYTIRESCELNFVDLAGSERLDKIIPLSMTTPNTHKPATNHNGGRGAGADVLSLTTESVHINKSLLALGKVIQMLAEGADREGRGMGGGGTSASSPKRGVSGGKGNNATLTSKTAGRLGNTTNRSSGGLNSTMGTTMSSGINGTATTTTMIPFRDSKLTMLLNHALGGNCITLLVACIQSHSSHTVESLATLTFASRARKVTNYTVVSGGNGKGGGGMVGAGGMLMDDDVVTMRLDAFKQLKGKLARLSRERAELSDALEASRRAAGALQQIVDRLRRISKVSGGGKKGGGGGCCTETACVCTCSSRGNGAVAGRADTSASPGSGNAIVICSDESNPRATRFLEIRPPPLPPSTASVTSPRQQLPSTCASDAIAPQPSLPSPRNAEGGESPNLPQRQRGSGGGHLLARGGQPQQGVGDGGITTSADAAHFTHATQQPTAASTMQGGGYTPFAVGTGRATTVINQQPDGGDDTNANDGDTEDDDNSVALILADQLTQMCLKYEQLLNANHKLRTTIEGRDHMIEQLHSTQDALEEQLLEAKDKVDLYERILLIHQQRDAAQRRAERERLANVTSRVDSGAFVVKSSGVGGGNNGSSSSAASPIMMKAYGGGISPIIITSNGGAGGCSSEYPPQQPPPPSLLKGGAGNMGIGNTTRSPRTPQHRPPSAGGFVGGAAVGTHLNKAGALIASAAFSGGLGNLISAANPYSPQTPTNTTTVGGLSASAQLLPQPPSSGGGGGPLGCNSLTSPSAAHSSRRHSNNPRGGGGGLGLLGGASTSRSSSLANRPPSPSAHGTSLSAR